MRISRKLAALAAFFVVAIAVAACGGGSSSSIPAGSVASVAGNPISKQAFNHWMFVAAKDQALQAAQQGATEPVIVANDPPQFTSCIKQIRGQIPTLAKAKADTLRSDCQQVFTQYNTEVMSFLIEGYWYQADAYKLGLKYSDTQLNTDFNKAIKKQFTSKTAFENYLKATGETDQDVRFQLRVNKLFSKLLKHYEQPITKARIAAYYKAHRKTFGTQETRDVHVLRTTSQAKAQAALSDLKSGKSWSTVAKQYSEDAAAKKNGALLTGITSGQEESAVNKAIFGNPVNKIVGPIKGIFGWYVVDVTKITPAKLQSLAKATPTVKQLLNSTEQQAAEKKVNALSKKSWFKRTTCLKQYQVTDCSNYTKPKTTTSTTSAPSTTPSTTITATTPSSTATTSKGSATKTSTTGK